MDRKAEQPWRLDTNERYREVVRLIVGLSSAALLLPVFLAREFLGIAATKPLKEVFSGLVYVSWPKQEDCEYLLQIKDWPKPVTALPPWETADQWFTEV